jgi:hypothetical protein
LKATVGVVTVAVHVIALAAAVDGGEPAGGGAAAGDVMQRAEIDGEPRVEGLRRICDTVSAASQVEDCLRPELTRLWQSPTRAECSKRSAFSR